MHWGLLALLSGVGLATRNVAFKVANGKIDAALGAVILSLAMALVTVGYLVFQRTAQGQPVFSGEYNLQGVALAALSGVGVAMANIFRAFSYKAEGPASLVAIIQNGFSISLTILIGVLLLGETIRPVQILGIFAAITGIVMIIRG